MTKYLILFLISICIILSVMLGIYIIDNKLLIKENERLSMMIDIQLNTIKKIESNLSSIQSQSKKLSIACDERLKARNDVSKIFSNQKNKEENIKNENVISKDTNAIVINTINDYWSWLLQNINSSNK